MIALAFEYLDMFTASGLEWNKVNQFLMMVTNAHEFCLLILFPTASQTLSGAVADVLPTLTHIVSDVFHLINL